MTDTIAAVSTGFQITAIGIVRLSGPDAIRIAETLFRPFSGKKVSEYSSRVLIYGTLVSGQGKPLDSCLCTISRAPNSYTGEDTCEFQCHGSPVLLRAVLDECFKLGARQAGPGEFTKRGFLNGKTDLISAEAVADIIDAENIESVINAAGQLTGAVSTDIDQICNSLMDISAHFHAVLDYPDEDIEDFQIINYTSILSSCENKLTDLIATFSRGMFMKEGIPAAIIGRPNAGKSSLLNKLLGYDRAIVTEIPGTTRDTIEEKLHYGHITLRLIDTAGIHETSDIVEQIGVSRSVKATKSADLVLLVIDPGSEPTEEDWKLIALAGKANHAIVVFSKSDLYPECEYPNIGLPSVSVSSVNGSGIPELLDTIQSYYPELSVPAGGILTNARQADAVSRALDYMAAAKNALEVGRTPDIILTETEGALHVLGELTGKTIQEEITNRIFSRFCVGK